MMRTLARLLLGGESRITITLLLVAMLGLTWGILDQDWLEGGGVLTLVALLATLVGFLLARWHVPGVLALLSGIVAGPALALTLVGDLAPPVWLWNRAPDLLTFWQQRLALFWARLAGWGNTASTGGESYDNLVLLLILLVVVWGAAFWAGWDLPRRRSALAALLPAGLVLLAVVGGSEEGRGRWAFLLFLVCAFLLLTRTSLTTLERLWNRQNKDYSGELYYDIFAYGFIVAIVLVAAAALLPLPAQNPLSQAIWTHLSGPVTAAQGVLGRVFAGAQHPEPGSGLLAHEIGGIPAAGDDVVFTVSTDEPRPLPPEIAAHLGDEANVPSHYWRDVVYDRYTGRGWETSIALTHSTAPNYPLLTDPPTGRRLVQTVVRRQPAASFLYAANCPVAVNSFTIVRGDLLGYSPALPGTAGNDVLAITGPAVPTYVVTSTLITATVAQLRAAPASYPAWLQDRYLTPPPTTGRVRALARDLTASASTPYDKAAVIEAYLRRLTYDTKVPKAPPDHDVVDDFLFVAQRGYCDHFATAMVVLCRAAGVPARLATGFASGEYDYHDYQYVVLQKYAHAWVEVYFPGYGWVEFEPTPALAVVVRPSGDEAPGPSAQQLLEQWQPKDYREEVPLAAWLLLGAMAGAVVLALSVLAYYVWRSPAPAGAVTAAEAYARLARRAERFRAGPQDWQTPREYLAALGRGLARGLARLPSALRWRMPDPGENLLELGTSYEAEQYGPHELDAREQARAWGIWDRWRNWVWVVVLGGRVDK